MTYSAKLNLMFAAGALCALSFGAGVLWYAEQVRASAKAREKVSAHPQSYCPVGEKNLMIYADNRLSESQCREYCRLRERAKKEQPK